MTQIDKLELDAFKAQLPKIIKNELVENPQVKAGLFESVDDDTTFNIIAMSLEGPNIENGLSAIREVLRTPPDVVFLSQARQRDNINRNKYYNPYIESKSNYSRGEYYNYGIYGYYSVINNSYKGKTGDIDVYDYGVNLVRKDTIVYPILPSPTVESIEDYGFVNWISFTILQNSTADPDLWGKTLHSIFYTDNWSEVPNDWHIARRKAVFKHLIEKNLIGPDQLFVLGGDINLHYEYIIPVLNELGILKYTEIYPQKYQVVTGYDTQIYSVDIILISKALLKGKKYHFQTKFISSQTNTQHRVLHVAIYGFKQNKLFEKTEKQLYELEYANAAGYKVFTGKPGEPMPDMSERVKKVEPSKSSFSAQVFKHERFKGYPAPKPVPEPVPEK